MSDKTVNVYKTLSDRITELEHLLKEALELLDSNPLGTMHDLTEYRHYRRLEHDWKQRAQALLDEKPRE